MAVVLSAFDLLVRVGALDRGVAAFAAAAPNRTFCTDGHLARLSFMTEADRDYFLATAGLPPGAYGRADRGSPGADVDWIEVGRHGGVLAAWLRDAPRDPLVVPLSWTPTEFEFASADALEHLEFLGLEDQVEVYLDRRTGKKLYTGRTRPTLPPEARARVEALLREGEDLVRPLLFKRPLGFFARRRLKRGMAALAQVIEVMPDAWPARWLLGMSHRALGQHARALEMFRAAYAICPEQPDVGREYAGQCFFCGAADEGVRISREVHARFPDDVGLQSNLALALLIGGDLAEAEATVQAALQREPGDRITRNLLALIQDVRAGLRPRPTRLPGM
ncbi:MAG: tetratricopeptide repeat protein [Kofleriaceae bacterium]